LTIIKFRSIKFPSSANYSTELLVRLYQTADVAVVLAKFIKCDDSILLLGVPERHEFHEDSSLGFAVGMHFWVFGGVIQLSDVIEFYGTIAVGVKLSVGSSNNIYSGSVEISL